VATDASAKTLDDQVSRISKEVFDKYFCPSSSNWKFCKKIEKKLLLEKGIYFGCAPDGGIWFHNNIPVIAFEAKKQGPLGNAIERHGKNFELLTWLNPNIRYITFAGGEGFEDGNGGHNYAMSVLSMCNPLGSNAPRRNINTIYKDKQSWIINPRGFSDDEIRDWIEKSIVDLT
jgi:hypothetical protein